MNKEESKSHLVKLSIASGVKPHSSRIRNKVYPHVLGNLREQDTVRVDL